MATTTDLVSWMKAAGEPSRLRLLALCDDRDLSVTDLARAVGQSGPRVSRHLKILCEAGLLDRVRHGQRVHYRLSESERAAQFLRGLLSQLERTDGVLKRDRQRARIEDSPEPATRAVGSRLGRTLAAFIADNAPARVATALLVGVRHPELLESAATLASTYHAIAPTRRAAQGAKEFADSRGLACEVVAADPVNALKSAGHLEAVILECLATPGAALAPLLAAARTALGESGRLWLFARYEALHDSPQRGATTAPINPLTAIRKLLSSARLNCELLSPLEADGEHVLGICAVPAAGAVRSSATASAIAGELA